MNQEHRRRHPRCTMAYAHLLRGLTGIANEHGYALAVHGSMSTDMDIILCPWTDEATEAKMVVEAVRQHVGGIPPKNLSSNPTGKPWHRLCWAFYFDMECAMKEDGPYLDISVMPKTVHSTR